MKGHSDWIVAERIMPEKPGKDQLLEDPRRRYDRNDFEAFPKRWYENFSEELEARGFRVAGNMSDVYATEFLCPDALCHSTWRDEQGRVFPIGLSGLDLPYFSAAATYLRNAVEKAVDRRAVDTAVFDIEIESEVDEMALTLLGYTKVSGDLWVAQWEDTLHREHNPYDALKRATWFYVQDPSKPDLELKDGSVILAEGDDENIGKWSQLYEGAFRSSIFTLRKVGSLEAPINKLNCTPRITPIPPHYFVSSLLDKKERVRERPTKITHILHPLHNGIYTYSVDRIGRTSDGRFVLNSNAMDSGLLDRLEDIGVAIPLQDPVDPAVERNIRVTDNRRIYLVNQELDTGHGRKNWWDVFDPNHADNKLVGSY